MHVAGKPILGHILDQVKELGIRDVVLILGYLGDKIKQYVESNYKDMKFNFAYQEEALGPGHAISLSEQFVKPNEKLLIIFGDTIFVGDMKKGLKSKSDASLAVKRVDDPRRFGVVVMKNGKVVDVAEKPDYVKPMDAMIGIYFISNSSMLFDALHTMIDTGRKTKGEFFLTDAIKIMLEKKANVSTFQMQGWFDCGKPETLLATNKYLLEMNNGGKPYASGENSIVIPPVFLGKGAKLKNSIVGPYVSVAENAVISTSIVKNSIINRNATIENAQFTDSLIGENAVVKDIIEKLNVGDNSEISFSGE